MKKELAIGICFGLAGILFTILHSPWVSPLQQAALRQSCSCFNSSMVPRYLTRVILIILLLP